MKTYLSLWFNSDGETPSAVTKKLGELGFKPVQGNYDLVYEWGNEPALEEILKLGDSVQVLLEGSKVLFKMESL